MEGGLSEKMAYEGPLTEECPSFGMGLLSCHVHEFSPAIVKKSCSPGSVEKRDLAKYLKLPSWSS